MIVASELEFLNSGYVVKKWGRRGTSKTVINIPITDQKCFDCRKPLQGIKSLKHLKKNGIGNTCECFSCHLKREELYG